MQFELKRGRLVWCFLIDFISAGKFQDFLQGHELYNNRINLLFVLIIHLHIFFLYCSWVKARVNLWEVYTFNKLGNLSLAFNEMFFHQFVIINMSKMVVLIKGFNSFNVIFKSLPLLKLSNELESALDIFIVSVIDFFFKSSPVFLISFLQSIVELRLDSKLLFQVLNSILLCSSGFLTLSCRRLTHLRCIITRSSTILHQPSVFKSQLFIFFIFSF